MPAPHPRFRFPLPVYPIIDTLGAPCRSHYDLAARVIAAGAPLLQLRVKRGATRQFLELARAVQILAARGGAALIVNDRADIACAVGAAGVHLGQDDLPPADVRRWLGPGAIIGWSTHSAEQVAAANRDAVVDYVGFGPVFDTQSKEHPDPVQGVDGLRRARAITALPLVAIGGITAERLPAVLAAGADAAAVIGAVVSAPDPGAAFSELVRRCRPA